MNCRTFCWIAAVTLVPFLAISMFCHPSVDDYAVADLVAKHGYWGGQAELYMSWVGRYASNAFVMAAGLEPNRASQVVPIILIVLLFGSIWRLVHVCWCGIFRNLESCADRSDASGDLFQPHFLKSLLLSLVVTAFYITRLPSVTQGLYWWSGSLTYTVGLCLAMLLFASLIAHPDHQNRSGRIASAAICAVLTAAAVGASETVMALVDGALLLGCGVLLLKKSPHLRLWIGILCVAGIGTMFDYFAPGTQTRMSAMPDAHQPIHSITHALFHTFRSLVVWSADPGLWCASIISVPVILVLFDRLSPAARQSLPKLSVVYVIWFLAHYGTVFPPYWAMGHGPPDRAQNVTYMVFLLGWWVSWFLLVARGSELWQTRLSQLKLQKRAAIGFCAFLPLFGGFQFAVFDCFSSAPDYDREWVLRHDAIRQHQEIGVQHLYVRSFVNQPRTIYYSDIGADPHEWHNQAFASYYGFETIAIRDSEIPKPYAAIGVLPSNSRLRSAERTELFHAADDEQAERRR